MDEANVINEDEGAFFGHITEIGTTMKSDDFANFKVDFLGALRVFPHSVQELYIDLLQRLGLAPSPYIEDPLGSFNLSVRHDDT